MTSGEPREIGLLRGTPARQQAGTVAGAACGGRDDDRQCGDGRRVHRRQPVIGPETLVARPTIVTTIHTLKGLFPTDASVAESDRATVASCNTS